MHAMGNRLFEFIEQELVAELDFLVSYDKARQAIQEIVDMPAPLVDLLEQSPPEAS